MQITTYRETYHQPTRMIEVPKAMQTEGFEVYFMPLPVQKKSDNQNSKTQGAGSVMRAYFADVPPPSNHDDDFVLPKRHVYTPIEME